MVRGEVRTRRASVCGIDPGDRSGVFLVTVTVQIGTHSTEVRSDFTTWEVTPAQLRGVLDVQLRVDLPIVVAVERYVVTSRTGRLTQQPTALQVTGVVQDHCRVNHVPLVQQMKSDAEKMGSDEVLKSLGWYQPGLPHANDAGRQALLALSSLEPIVFEALMRDGRIDRTR